MTTHAEHSPREVDPAPTLPPLMMPRRKFLQALAALGLPLNVEGPLADKSDAEIDMLWEDAKRSPMTFEVDDRTIYAQGANYPGVFADVVDTRSIYENHQQLLDDMDDCEDLQWHFDMLCETSDQPETWEWVKTLSMDTINAEVSKWLESPLPLDYEVPLHLGPMGEAYRFFGNLGRETLKALGVVIVEGEHPGSSYYAAELRTPVPVANATAVRLGLPIRFA